ncbi:hypothetical protein V1504DRAFT_432985, partial [Lipomyces starkeyi]
MDALAKDVLHLPDNYNSDDEEFSDGERTVHKQGFANCQELFKNALENRRHSKKTLQNHQPERVSPGKTLPQQENISIGSLIRYHEQSRLDIVETIKGGLKHLSATLSEIYEDFKISTQKSIQCDSLLNKLVKDGILHKGYWSKHHR